MCPGGHLEGFEACLKRRSELRTWARNLFVFQRKIKDLHDNLYKMNVFSRKIKDLNDHLKKIIEFSKENQGFQR
jgi:hypothetical protein